MQELGSIIVHIENNSRYCIYLSDFLFIMSCHNIHESGRVTYLAHHPPTSACSDSVKGYKFK